MAKQSYIIGRGGHVTLYDDTVSRRHACLEVEDGVLFLRDLESRNGTYEIRDKKLVPFTSGVVFSDQVFAFGECVRSVTQLLKEAGVTENSENAPAGVDDNSEHDEDALNSTQIGFQVPAGPRLSGADIIEMLENIETQLEDGGVLSEICAGLNITEQRYQRWCGEHGVTRHERERSVADLKLENAHLRMLVADLSLERNALQQALLGSGSSVDIGEHDTASQMLSNVSRQRSESK